MKKLILFFKISFACIAHVPRLGEPCAIARQKVPLRKFDNFSKTKSCHAKFCTLIALLYRQRLSLVITSTILMKCALNMTTFWCYQK